MQPLTVLFVLAVLVGTATRLWLANRQIAAVTRHRTRVPEPFAHSVSPADHLKAADYAVARTRLGRIDTVIDALVLLGLTLGGGIRGIDQLSRPLGLGGTVARRLGHFERVAGRGVDRAAPVAVEHLPA